MAAITGDRAVASAPHVAALASRSRDASHRQSRIADQVIQEMQALAIRSEDLSCSIYWARKPTGCAAACR
ncbi:hypothetical protein DSL92_00540 [Billgrantia gudaonensis]|uniref:Uncharacterized protein n=1 Tax=Billgrantia gudaonensis TaxID=376427 RepID=A0A432JL39_9GAMM|nr:hypothetical protein DSL92_00540 [Halomonas gudaonensis]